LLKRQRDFPPSTLCFQCPEDGAQPACADARVRNQKGGHMSEETKTERELNAEEVSQPRVTSPGSRSSASFVAVRNTLPSDVDVVSPFVDQLMRFISRFRVADGENFEIELALREAIVNAIVHGNQEDPRKRVYVNCRCMTDGEVAVTVEDEGIGFRSDAIPDPTSPENRLRTHGRGIYLMRTLMDEVDFEQGGSVVHMRKRVNAGSGTTGKPQ
jgi:serine/threonine-protein kinase RsbW